MKAHSLISHCIMAAALPHWTVKRGPTVHTNHRQELWTGQVTTSLGLIRLRECIGCFSWRREQMWAFTSMGKSIIKKVNGQKLCAPSEPHPMNWRQEITSRAAFLHEDQKMIIMLTSWTKVEIGSVVCPRSWHDHQSPPPHVSASILIRFPLLFKKIKADTAYLICQTVHDRI